TSCAQQVQDTLPLDQELRYGKLDNGFTYYIRKTTDVNPKNRVYVRLVGQAGYWLASNDQLELPHLMEHMNIFAPTKLGTYFLWQEKVAQDVLSSYSGFNAFTTPEFVNYGMVTEGKNRDLLNETLSWARV